MNKPFSESCEQNKQVILSVIKQFYTKPGTVLEIGSGTGQHAVYFAEHLPHLYWQTSDRQENIAAINAWLEELPAENLPEPLCLDVNQTACPVSEADYVFSANTVHIMSWESVLSLFDMLGGVLKKDGFFALYGPFNYHGAYTSESNASFDQWLKQRDPQSGIRDFEALNQLAQQENMSLVQDVEMPANNRTLIWQKQ